MAKKKRADASAVMRSITSAVAQASVAGAATRASKRSGATGKDLKKDAKSAESLLATAAPRERKNSAVKAAGTLRAGVSIKSGRFVRSVTAAKPARSFGVKKRMTVTDRVFRPMTRAQAVHVSEASHDPDLPKRKLPPRP
ncbi:hypothetical protein ABT275_44720 [Streptomyces sp. NPDC001185]|uniref:hypothetical protein n=1 Tax=Streptomyces sp. NPDC001185 TaxID=3154380 RepID=UPI003325011B